MSVRASRKSRMSLLSLTLVAVCVVSVSARPSIKITLPMPTPKPTLKPTPKPTLPPLTTIVVPKITNLEITTQTEADAGAKDTPCGPFIDVSSGVAIQIKEDGVTRRADAKTGARGGCGPLFAQVDGGTTTKVGDKDPLIAKSVTTIVGNKDIAIGISQSHSGALVHSKKRGVPATAIAALSQSSGLASKNQKTTHVGSGTISSNGVVVINTAGDLIRADLERQIKRSKCRKGGKGCPPPPTVPTIKPTLPPLPKPTLKPHPKPTLPKLFH